MLSQPHLPALCLRLLAASLLLACPASAQEQRPAPEEGEPRPCVGYNAGIQNWGIFELQAGTWFNCPPNTALFGVADSGGHGDDAQAAVYGNCCPLPSSDILTDAHVIADVECPDGYVVTGYYYDRRSDHPYPERKRPMRCTMINSAKYALGPPRPGLHWGVASAAAFPWQEYKKLRIDEVPAAIRYGISRVNRKAFTFSGCIGEPGGSLLTAKHRDTCRGYIWRELLVKSGRERRPVKMFPDCEDGLDIFDPDARCPK